MLRRRTRAETTLLRRQHAHHDVITDQCIHFHPAAHNPYQSEPQEYILLQTAPQGQDHDPNTYNRALTVRIRAIYNSYRQQSRLRLHLDYIWLCSSLDHFPNMLLLHEEGLALLR